MITANPQKLVFIHTNNLYQNQPILVATWIDFIAIAVYMSLMY